MLMARNVNFNQWVAITKSDTVNLEKITDAVYVGGAGDVAFVSQSDVAVTFSGAVAGSILPVAAKRINSTNTTATNLVALYQV